MARSARCDVNFQNLVFLSDTFATRGHEAPDANSMFKIRDCRLNHVAPEQRDERAQSARCDLNFIKLLRILNRIFNRNS